MHSQHCRIQVPIKSQPYEVVVGDGSLETIAEELIKVGIMPGVKILVVTNEDVIKPYGEKCLKELENAGYKASLLILEKGENNKTLKNISIIHDAAYKAKLERGSLMIALGGGVIGDMTGFAAATWLRGIPVVQIPTSLLAMVDASIGGKTGVNHPGGKNLIGAFHQPKLVLIDPLTLKTLPEREFKCGIAEVIKYAVIGDPELFKLLEKIDISNNLQNQRNVLKEIIESSVKAKSKIVSLDETESGIRAILNYGHTFGHAVETLCGYGKYLHGEAVAIGMVAVGHLAVQKTTWKDSENKRQLKLIKKFGLPTKWPLLDTKSVLDVLQGDKKVVGETIRFILPNEIGKVEISSDIKNEDISICLDNLKL